MSGIRQGEGNPSAREVSGVMLYRFDAPLVFSNAGAFKASGQQILIDTAARGPLPSTLVIDFEEAFYTDSSGAESIRGLKRYASRYDVEILIARLHADARQTLAQDGVLAEIGEDYICDIVHAAVAASNGPTEQQDKSTEQEDKGPGR